MEIVQHATDDTLERYSMRTLPAPEVESLEEHLLICSECRDRLESTEQYVAAMRAAAAKIRRGGKGIAAMWADGGGKIVAEIVAETVARERYRPFPVETTTVTNDRK